MAPTTRLFLVTGEVHAVHPADLTRGKESLPDPMGSDLDLSAGTCYYPGWVAAVAPHNLSEGERINGKEGLVRLAV
jgi:hypothetical protein